MLTRQGGDISPLAAAMDWVLFVVSAVMICSLLMLAATAVALPQPDMNVKCPSGEELVRLIRHENEGHSFCRELIHSTCATVTHTKKVHPWPTTVKVTHTIIDYPPKVTKTSTKQVTFYIHFCNIQLIIQLTTPPPNFIFSYTLMIFSSIAIALNKMT
ncbi:hypothetical protein N7449_006796 [Penicillium cf. viridicatum]|uniref:Uncharacterized protein n=1 Tax=Penicillium cf. viridicatum TaxID=2972119 RepID=A0A9W9JHZ6_9EURO|nr:hypothetical protein N7449_006796 [Penicillium cf. viridicatum]